MSLGDIKSIDELQTIMIFGVGSLFLYLVVPVALFANEVRLAQQSDDTSGTAAIFNSIVQSFFFIIAWSVFVSVIFFMVVRLGGSDATNPAVGVDRYWQGKWLVSDERDRLMNNFPATSTSVDGSIRKQAKFIVFIVTSAKALELLLLGVLLALTLKLSMSLPLLKMRRADHYKMTSQIDVGTMMSIFMTGILGWVIFTAILNFESILLNSLRSAGASVLTPTTIIDVANKTEMIDGLKNLLELGMEELKK